MSDSDTELSGDDIDVETLPSGKGVDDGEKKEDVESDSGDEAAAAATDDKPAAAAAAEKEEEVPAWTNKELAEALGRCIRDLETGEMVCCPREKRRGPACEKCCSESALYRELPVPLGTTHAEPTIWHKEGDKVDLAEMFSFDGMGAVPNPSEQREFDALKKEAEACRKIIEKSKDKKSKPLSASQRMAVEHTLANVEGLIVKHPVHLGYPGGREELVEKLLKTAYEKLDDVDKKAGMSFEAFPHNVAPLPTKENCKTIVVDFSLPVDGIGQRELGSYMHSKGGPLYLTVPGEEVRKALCAQGVDSDCHSVVLLEACVLSTRNTSTCDLRVGLETVGLGAGDNYCVRTTTPTTAWANQMTPQESKCTTMLVEPTADQMKRLKQPWARRYLTLDAERVCRAAAKLFTGRKELLSSHSTYKHVVCLPIEEEGSEDARLVYYIWNQHQTELTDAYLHFAAKAKSEVEKKGLQIPETAEVKLKEKEKDADGKETKKHKRAIYHLVSLSVFKHAVRHLCNLYHTSRLTVDMRFPLRLSLTPKSSHGWRCMLGSSGSSSGRNVLLDVSVELTVLPLPHTAGDYHGSQKVAETCCTKAKQSANDLVNGCCAGGGESCMMPLRASAASHTRAFYPPAARIGKDSIIDDDLLEDFPRRRGVLEDEDY